MTTFYMIGIALAIIAVVVIVQAVSIVRDIVRERDWRIKTEARIMLWEAQRELQEIKAQRATIVKTLDT